MALQYPSGISSPWTHCKMEFIEFLWSNTSNLSGCQTCPSLDNGLGTYRDRTFVDEGRGCVPWLDLQSDYRLNFAIVLSPVLKERLENFIDCQSYLCAEWANVIDYLGD